MAIEYTLRMANSKISIEYISNIFKGIGIEIIDIQNLDLGFEIFAFKPDIRFNLTFIKKLDKGLNHPSNYYETNFLINDLYYNEILSFRFEKNLNHVEYNEQFNMLLKIIFEIVKDIDVETLLTGSGGNEIFIYRYETFIVESEYYHMICDYQKDIIVNYHCVESNGRLFNE